MNSKSIQLPKGKINYVIYNPNNNVDTIVFLHGFLGSHQIWLDFIQHFGKQFNILAIDLPGHGNSTYIDDVLQMEDMASTVLAVLNTEKVINAHFVGHSMGGYVTLALTKLNKEIIRSITLFNSSLYADTEENKKNRKAAVRLLELKPSILVNEIIQNLFRPESVTTFASEFNKIKEIALSTKVKAVQASLLGMSERENFYSWSLKGELPIQLIAGVFDTAVPYELSKQQTKESPTELITLENTVHMGFIEEKERSIDALTSFFNKN